MAHRIRRPSRRPAIPCSVRRLCLPGVSPPCNPLRSRRGPIPRPYGTASRVPPATPPRPGRIGRLAGPAGSEKAPSRRPLRPVLLVSGREEPERARGRSAPWVTRKASTPGTSHGPRGAGRRGRNPWAASKSVGTQALASRPAPRQPGGGPCVGALPTRSTGRGPAESSCQEGPAFLPVSLPSVSTAASPSSATWRRSVFDRNGTCVKGGVESSSAWPRPLVPICPVLLAFSAFSPCPSFPGRGTHPARSGSGAQARGRVRPRIGRRRRMPPKQSKSQLFLHFSSVSAKPRLSTGGSTQTPPQTLGFATLRRSIRNASGRIGAPDRPRAPDAGRAARGPSGPAEDSVTPRPLEVSGGSLPHEAAAPAGPSEGRRDSNADVGKASLPPEHARAAARPPARCGAPPCGPGLARKQTAQDGASSAAPLSPSPRAPSAARSPQAPPAP